MSLELWKTNGWLREYETSAQEVASILALVERDLEDAAKKEISTDWRFNIAYNAGLQLATVVLYATKRNYLDNCRRKRNVSEYDAAGTISKKEAEDLLQTVGEFKIEVVRWLKKNHPLIYSRE